MPKLKLLLLAGLACATPAIAQEAPTSFGNWHVTCRDDGYCAAAAAATTAGGPPPFVAHVGRPAQQTYWEVGVAAIAAVADPAAPFTATVDKTALKFAPGTEVAAYGAVTDYYFLGASAETLLTALVPGRSLQIAFTALDGAAVTAQFPLTGLSAALMAIDTRQRRVGAERVAGPPPFGLAPIRLEKVRIAGGGTPDPGPPLFTTSVFDPPVLPSPPPAAPPPPAASP